MNAAMDLAIPQLWENAAVFRATQLAFVPLSFDGEVHQVKLQNTSLQTKKIKLFSFVEFCLWNAYDDMTNYQRNLNTGEVEIQDSVIYHKTEYRERRNHYAFSLLIVR